MALSTEQRQSIDRARKRVAETTIPVERELFGEAFVFRFLPTLTQPALEIVGRVQELGEDGGSIARQFGALVDFMDVMSTDDTGELIATLAKDGILTIDDLVGLQMEVIEAVSGRPTMRSSSSVSGSGSSGESSTASALPEALTPTS